MGEVLLITYGTLISALDKEGAPYTDWRSIYLDWPGMIVVRKSEDDPDKKVIWLYPYAEGETEQPYFHTSAGTVSGNEEQIAIKTSNSEYVFSLDDECLTEEQKSSLFYGIVVY